VPSTGAVPRVLAIQKGREGVEHARIPLEFEYKVYRFREATGAGPKNANGGEGRKETAGSTRKLKPRASKGE
jgi:hypothetical protein